MKLSEISEIKLEGGKRALLAEDLARHAARAPRAPKFSISVWLRRLPDEQLGQLGRAALHASAGVSDASPDELEELHAVILIATQAELRQPEIRLDPETYPTILLSMLGCVSAERCRRLGWIIVERPPGLCVNTNFELRLTEKGRREHVEGRDRILDSVMVLLRRLLLPPSAAQVAEGSPAQVPPTRH